MNWEVKFIRGHMVPPLLLVYNGLARPADECCWYGTSSHLDKRRKTRQTTGHSDNIIASAAHSLLPRHNKKLSCRRETARCFVSLNIFTKSLRLAGPFQPSALFLPATRPIYSDVMSLWDEMTSVMQTGTTCNMVTTKISYVYDDDCEDHHHHHYHQFIKNTCQTHVLT